MKQPEACHAELVSASQIFVGRHCYADTKSDTSLPSNPPTLISSKKAAFTLAEVLVTLGIIGVVAALTMPSLISNHRKKEVETKLAKVYSMMNQAINLAKVENGDFEEWADFVPICGDSSNIKCTSEQAIDVFNQYIGKHLQYVKIVPDNEKNCFFIYLKDGSILRVHKIIRDIAYLTNKKAIENPKSGINYFNFRFAPVLVDDVFNLHHLNKGFEPYAYSWDGTLEDLSNDNNYGCKETVVFERAFCAKLIQMNGWKIPDNYPFKF